MSNLALLVVFESNRYFRVSSVRNFKKMYKKYVSMPVLSSTKVIYTIKYIIYTDILGLNPQIFIFFFVSESDSRDMGIALRDSQRKNVSHGGPES